MDRSSITALSNEVAESRFVNIDSVTGIHVPDLAEPIIDGVLRRGHMMMIAGPPKAGKTWSMVQLAYAVATGNRWMGFQCHMGRVAYVDTELDHNSLYNRFDNVRAAMGLSDSGGNLNAWSLRGIDMSAEDVADEIEKAYAEPPDLVIIDSIYSLETGDENSAGDMRGMLKQLARITSRGTAVTFAHHHAKGNAGARNVIDRGSGSGVFGRFVDAMVDLTPIVPNEDQAARLVEEYGERAVPMRMSFVLREFADPGNRSIVFRYPLLRDITGGYMDGAPEAGSAEAARMKGGESNRRRNDRRWGHIDESIGRAVNQCMLEGVPPTRQNVADRMTMDGSEVTIDNVRRWTRKEAATKWRARKDGSEWVVYCTDESWSTDAHET